MTAATGPAGPVRPPVGAPRVPPSAPRTVAVTAGPGVARAGSAAEQARVTAAAGPAGWAAVAAFGALAGGLLHGAVAVAHAGHGTGWVIGFAAAGGAQLVLAAVLRRRPHPAVLLLAVAGTVALVGWYVAGQLALPDPGGHHRLPSWSADVRLAAVVVDLVTVASISALLTGRWRTWSGNLALTGGVVLWGWWLLGW